MKNRPGETDEMQPADPRGDGGGNNPRDRRRAGCKKAPETHEALAVSDPVLQSDSKTGPQGEHGGTQPLAASNPKQLDVDAAGKEKRRSGAVSEVMTKNAKTSPIPPRPQSSTLLPGRVPSLSGSSRRERRALCSLRFYVGIFLGALCMLLGFTFLTGPDAVPVLPYHASDFAEGWVRDFLKVLDLTDSVQRASGSAQTEQVLRSMYLKVHPIAKMLSGSGGTKLFWITADGKVRYGSETWTDWDTRQEGIDLFQLECVVSDLCWSRPTNPPFYVLDDNAPLPEHSAYRSAFQRLRYHRYSATYPSSDLASKPQAGSSFLSDLLTNANRMGRNFLDSRLFRMQELYYLQEEKDSLKSGDALQPGKDFIRKYGKGKDMVVKHPVVMIPGIVSTGLEIWKAKPCAEKYFRQRIWGSMNMARALLLDRHCWLSHMLLDENGLDPPGIKLRPSSGLEAADYLIGPYWVWARIIDNLAYIGYDTSSMYFASYDWRLDIERIETRDKGFRRLKVMIEEMVSDMGEKAVVISHSLGALVFLYFMKWVESGAGGDGGHRWIEKHVAAWANIAGPMLGTAKSISSLVSGEMKDTAQVGWLPSYLMETLLSIYDRKALFWSWGSVISLLPKGGARIWGNSTYAPDFGATTGSPNLFVVDDAVYGASDIHRVFQDWGGVSGELVASRLSRKVELGEMEDIWTPDFDQDDDRTWSNPLTTKLPYAPSLKIYCIYGVGKETERGYVYRKDDRYADNPQQGETRNVRNVLSTAGLKESRARLHVDVTDASRNIWNGVFMHDGDGTVPTMSLGYMCVEGWKQKRHNPANAGVITREIQHAPDSFDLRGGPKTGDHVDILGNFGVIGDLLALATGMDEKAGVRRDRIVSDIVQYAKAVKQSGVSS